MTYIFWGYILVFFNFKINGFDLLSNFLGYIFIFIGLAKLEGIHFKKAKAFAVFMAINSLLFTIGGLAGASFEVGLFATYNLFTVGIWIYISYLIVLGIKDLEFITGKQIGFKKLFTIWKIQVILQVITRLFVFTQNEILLLIASIFAIILIAMNVIFLVYFYKAKTIYQSKSDSNHINVDEAIKPKQPILKIKRALLIFVILVIVLVSLWAKGVFYIIDIQTSPNGKITEIVYNQDVSDTFPKDSGITMRTKGSFKGTTVYENASYLNMWWSPCSNYLVKSLVDGEPILILDSFKKNSSSNLSAYINMSISSSEEFTNLMTDKKHWETIEFDFVKWNDEQGSMTVNFEFEDCTGKQQKGCLDFNCETGVVSNIEFK